MIKILNYIEFENYDKSLMLLILDKFNLNQKNYFYKPTKIVIAKMCLIHRNIKNFKLIKKLNLNRSLQISYTSIKPVAWASTARCKLNLINLYTRTTNHIPGYDLSRNLITVENLNFKNRWEILSLNFR